MLNDFREWLSDNLRYFMLGGAILLVLLVLIFGIRACTKGSSKKKTEETPKTQEQDESLTSEEKKKNDVESEAEQKEEKTNQLEDADEEFTQLIEDYYKALGDKDIDTLRTLVDDLSAADESKIINSGDYIERYEVEAVYMKDGLDENSYVVYADYQYYCQDIAAAVPALSQFYVQKKADGSLIIDGNAETDSVISDYTNTLQKNADVKDLADSVKKKNQKALEENPELKEFLEGLGTDESSTAKTESGPMMIANDVCNVRDNPGGDVIGGIDVGSRVEKLGEVDGWIQIEYEGRTGYIYSDLLDEAE